MSQSEPRCDACGAPLERVFELEPGRPDYQQYDNALHIAFSGGYGEFVDAPFHVNERGEGPESLRAVICHACAHSLAEQTPWIARLLRPESSHTHRLG